LPLTSATATHPHVASSPEDPSNAPEPPRAEGMQTEPLARGQAMRERLIAKAAAARQPHGDAGPNETSESDPAAQNEARPEVAPLELELDLVAGAGQPKLGTGANSSRRGQLSPNVLALFGTLLGLATVSSLVALGIHLDPQQHRAKPAPSAAVSAAPAPPKPAAPAPLLRDIRPRNKLPGPWRIQDAKGDPALKVIEGQVGALPFLKAIQQAGVPEKEGYRVLKILGKVKNLDNCDKSDRFLALLERSGLRLTAFEYQVSPEEVYQAKQDARGILVAEKLDLKVARNQVRGAFVIDTGGIDASAQKAGFEPGLAKVLAKTLDGHLSLDELSRGDRLRVIAQEVAVLGQFSRYAGIEALELEFQDPSVKPLRVYWFQGPTSRGHYDAGARAPFEGGWRKPIKDAEVTSKFNPKRLHPVLKKVMPHNGTDFGAAVGTPVGASTYGTVSFLGYAGPSGNLVKVEHSNGITTGYAHLSRFAEGLKVGDKVKRLQLVGYVGSTGRSTGPHLHFSAEKADRFFDPETLNLDGMRILPPSERDPFNQVKARYDALLDAISLPEALPPLPSAELPSADPESAPFASAPVAPTAPAAPATTASVAGPATAAPATAPGSTPATAVYLSDKELLKLQSATDEGEVEE
jgi:hypothetical protein